MKVKNFVISGLIGSIVVFLLDGLFYNVIFKDYFPSTDVNDYTLLYILIGELVYGLFVSYIFIKWAQIKTFTPGARAGAIIGLFLGIYISFFHMALMADAKVSVAVLDTGIMILTSAVMGGLIGVVNGKLR